MGDAGNIDPPPGTHRVWPLIGSDDEEAFERLRRVSLLDGLGDDQLRRVMQIGERQKFERNEMIFREDDPGDRIYLLLSGAVRISRQVPGMGEEALAILQAGSAFGEMALIDGSPRSADALAHESCELFVIDNAQLDSLMFVDRILATEILWKLVRMLTSRLRQTNDKMVFLSVCGRFE
jgi:CRP/FNR family cyclic AMP-dependent transcriptional regulator